ncbi:MAG: hypothetical protein V4736_15030 [Bdellovibrionota bacterium]
MKPVKALILGLTVLVLGSFSQSQTAVVTIADYNNALPYWGVSWAPGAKSLNGYYASFYTGFAPRMQYTERIHLRTSRGNQTRLSLILDEQTIMDFPFDLAKRYEFYKKMTSGTTARLDIKPKSSVVIPQLAYFNQIVEGPTYDVLNFVNRANQGLETKETIYAKGLRLITALNPNRIFPLQIDLKREFNNWKVSMQKLSGGDAKKITASPTNIVTALDTLVFGRVNVVVKPSADVLAKLDAALNAALTNAADEVFVNAAFDLFKTVTGSKYDISYVNANGQWQKALQCSVASCTLTYTEFTAIYPTGSAEAHTTDAEGNRINDFTSPGLWNFVAYSGRDVDNIRDEPYYGFAPKMDYDATGNGFHNPAVRFWDPSKALKTSLGIPTAHNTFWAPKRGAISHGCLRVALGHLWEMRQIFPVENSKMLKMHFFGNASQDFDVYDINGDGQLEVMGVEYLISYGTQGVGDVARREGAELSINNDKKVAFYTTLYGAKNVFSLNAAKVFEFTNPRISLPSYLDLVKRKVNTRITLEGVYPLFEQTYERDKAQLYAIGEMTPENKKVVRLMGRVRGCAPFSDKTACGETAFDEEAKVLVR